MAEECVWFKPAAPRIMDLPAARSKWGLAWKCVNGHFFFNEKKIEILEHSVLFKN